MPWPWLDISGLGTSGLDLGTSGLGLAPNALVIIPEIGSWLHIWVYDCMCSVGSFWCINIPCFRYAIVWKKGYQEYDDVLSSVSTKVKGIAVTNYTELNITHPDKLDFRIWDVADYVMPPQVIFNFINSPVVFHAEWHCNSFLILLF